MDGLANKAGMKKGKEAIAEIVGLLMMSRTVSHMSHLKTNSYAKHVALEGFYDEVLGHVDRLAEAAQGMYGKLDVPFINMKGNVDDPIVTLEGHLTLIKRLGKSCNEMSFIQSIMDEIVACYKRTLYKLKELN